MVIHPPMRPPYFVHAWIGGDYRYDEKDFKLARDLYREMLKDYRSYWHERPSPDTRLILKNRARHDAYATRRYADSA